MTNLTTLELAVLKSIDNSDYGDLLRDAVWFWAKEMAAEIGISAMALGGVVSSLQEKGMVHVYIADARARKMGDDSTINMSAAGVDAYIAAVGETRKRRDYREGE